MYYMFTSPCRGLGAKYGEIKVSFTP